SKYDECGYRLSTVFSISRCINRKDYSVCISNNFAAQLALSFLQKDWLDERGSKQLKGPVFNKAVSIVLERYIFLRKESKRLLVIQWLLANKLSLLVPEKERRRSKISILDECKDDEIRTFHSVYKVLFHCLNDAAKQLSMSAARCGLLDLDECLLQWKRAASIFCLLALLIRVKVNIFLNNIFDIYEISTSEMFIRTVHSAMIGVECDEAFQIGLLKSRNLDVSSQLFF
ncbi:unnamed protein product, partial [Dracunculus medinensis]|uniref:RAB3GAP2_C domain-containing protein n=1 Tax=Dracunculus medinensis TaxID=318479 RepID=A0A0N4UJE7_DRAME